MRKDALGLLWQDNKRPYVEKVREMPPIPTTGWQAPRQFPNLASAATLAVDVETYDPELCDHKNEWGETIKGKGPGWGRGRGHIVGVSVGTSDGGRWYFPMRHECQPEGNLNPEHVLAWLRATLGNPRQAKVGANLMYDVGWLEHEGVHVAGELVDVQYAEALLSETGRTGLDVLGGKYLAEGKVAESLYVWAAAYYGGPATGEARRNIYRCPPCLVGPYAESDVDLPLRIIREQYPLLVQQGLVDLFRMECSLIPLLVAMRRRGVAVDVPRAEELRETLLERESATQARINQLAGYEVNTNAAASIAPALVALGITCPLTPKTGQPSVTKGFLEQLDSVPLAGAINELRKLAKLRGTFVEGAILGSHVNGRVHGSLHPLRADEGGTRSGRLSASSPNLQNIPSRDEELAPMLRGLFIPDPGSPYWRKYDYSQIEYRQLASDAVGPGSTELRAQYTHDPRTDYHVHTQAMVQHVLGMAAGRKSIKTINFGLIYGMGKTALRQALGLSRAESTLFFNAYHTAAPYARATMAHYSDLADAQGYVTTILGRRSRFDLWEPARWGRGDDARFPALPYAAACSAYDGNIRRAMLHKALNRRLQGSAADILKCAMLKMWESGVFDVVGLPLLTVHDELDFNDANTNATRSAFREVQHIMETALPISVPIIADVERGTNWGNVADF